MISSIHIKNFKSVVDLEINLGRVNVFIGENGCGKTNILEAIAFGAAASADKLDFEFLGSRGIRLTKPEFMYSAFEKGSDTIELKFSISNRSYHFQLSNSNKSSNIWENLIKTKTFDEAFSILAKAFIEKQNSTDSIDNMMSEFVEKYKNVDDFKESFNEIKPIVLKKLTYNEELKDFIVYSPEESHLRKFYDTNQIYPLGIKGEGLFQYLKELSQKKDKSKLLDKIKDNLVLLDWFDDFNLPKNLMSNEYALQIRDKYLNEDLSYFDQKSTNEGFLYLLFYFTLFCSDITPKFFAVDNIDSSLNPRLCTQLTTTLAKLAKENDKQAILTTHNPAILDGLDLEDDDQRLFVVSRNIDGHTKVRRIMHKPERTKSLSEIWTSGFIGGLPKNF